MNLQKLRLSPQNQPSVMFDYMNQHFSFMAALIAVQYEHCFL